MGERATGKRGVRASPATDGADGTQPVRVWDGELQVSHPKVVKRATVVPGFPSSHAYPTVEHAAAAEAIVAFFRNQLETDAVLLVNSCARGKATPDSCLDMLVLARTEEAAALDARWRAFFAHEEAFRRLRRAGKFSELHLDVADGVFVPVPHDIDLGFDDLELNIGNALVYSVPLYQRGSRLRELCGKWLPYYGEDLRAERLEGIARACHHHLDHIPLYAARDLYFSVVRPFLHGIRSVPAGPLHRPPNLSHRIQQVDSGTGGGTPGPARALCPTAPPFRDRAFREWRAGCQSRRSSRPAEWICAPFSMRRAHEPSACQASSIQKEEAGNLPASSGYALERRVTAWDGGSTGCPY